MEWLPLAAIGILIINWGIYFIVKWAVKDALKNILTIKKIINPDLSGHPDPNFQNGIPAATGGTVAPSGH